MVNIDSFNKQCQCIYKSEKYSVRDNGSIFRHSKPNKRKRPLDEKWTFGNPCKHKGYMNLSSETVHRIVATAFHGVQPSTNHVVDHIDTNKKNNRPENLRWVTKLENILLNPISLYKIVLKYGSIDNFFKNPSKPLNGELEQNFGWMRSVSKEESNNARENLIKWALAGKTPNRGLLGEWIFEKKNIQINPYIPLENPKSNLSNTEKFKLVELTLDDIYQDSNSSSNYIHSKTPNAAQTLRFIDEKPNEYPCTPEIIEGEPLNNYYNNLKTGSPFFKNHNGEYVVVKSKFSNDKRSILVMSKADYIYVEQEDGEITPVSISQFIDKPSNTELNHSLNEITFENDLFIHTKLETGFHPTEELEEIFENYS